MTLTLIIGDGDADMPDRSWMQQAACSGADPDLWHPGVGGVDAAGYARTVCAGCPVIDACLDYAIDNHETLGIWGGLAPRERRTVARQRRGIGEAW
jgi:WhiB family redox-sensing transcriptional regulator